MRRAGGLARLGDMFSVYMHTAPNGKVYIGITSQPPEVRWKHGHGYSRNKLFYRAIVKYGWDNFKHEVLIHGLSKEDAKQFEVAMIALYKSNNPAYGYNITEGGDYAGGYKRTISDLQRQTLSKNWEGTKNPNARKVICLETKVVYNTATEAMKETGATKICDCCKRMHKHKTSGGYHWAYYDERLPLEAYERLLEKYVKEESVPRPMNEKTKQMLRSMCVVRVVCVETGQVFESMREAADAVGASPSNICNCCKGKKKTTAGYHWKYIGE